MSGHDGGRSDAGQARRTNCALFTAACPRGWLRNGWGTRRRRRALPRPSTPSRSRPCRPETPSERSARCTPRSRAGSRQRGGCARRRVGAWPGPPARADRQHHGRARARKCHAAPLLKSAAPEGRRDLAAREPGEKPREQGGAAGRRGKAAEGKWRGGPGPRRVCLHIASVSYRLQLVSTGKPRFGSAPSQPFSDAMSITKRYFTSLRSMRS